MWVGVFAEVADYCPSGGWDRYASDGWHWHYDRPNIYHEAQTSARQSRSCAGHYSAADGGHNVHNNSGSVDFTGWTDAH